MLVGCKLLAPRQDASQPKLVLTAQPRGFVTWRAAGGAYVWGSHLAPPKKHVLLQTRFGVCGGPGGRRPHGRAFSNLEWDMCSPKMIWNLATFNGQRHPGGEGVVKGLSDILSSLSVL